MKSLLTKILSLMLVMAMTVAAASAAAFPEDSTVQLPLEANITTGYIWTGFVLGGDSVELDSAQGVYESDPNPDNLDGVGGTTYYTIRALHPGESIIGFAYRQGWDSSAFVWDMLYLASVDEDGTITLTDVTDSGMLTGTVQEVNEEDHSVLLLTDTVGEVIARFADEMMPTEGENITVYINGTMTMSLPAIVNVIAWGSNPSDLAREDARQSDMEELLLETADRLTELASDTAYVRMMTANDEIQELAASYAALHNFQPVKWTALGDAEQLMQLSEAGEEELSDLAHYILEQKMYSGTVLSTSMASRNGVAAVAASSVLTYTTVCNADLPSDLYLLEYETGAGIVVGVWNNGVGQNVITASFVPDAAALSDIFA